MNKQELIEKYAKFEEDVRKQGWNIEDLDSFDRGELAGESQLVSMLLNDLKQLDEPEITEEQAWNKIAESYPADVRSLVTSFQNFYYGDFIKNPTISKKETVE